MIKTLVLAKKIKTQRGELEALQTKDAGFKAREDELLADIEAAESVLDVEALVAKALEEQTWVRVKP